MTLQYGGDAYLCDGCGSQICQTEFGKSSAKACFPSGASVLALHTWDDSGPDSQARQWDNSSLNTLVDRHFCAACTEVAEDTLRQAFPRLPVVENLSAHPERS